MALWLALGMFMAWDARTEMRSVSTQTDTLAEAFAAHTTRVMREADELAAVVAWHVQREGVTLPLNDYVNSGLFNLDVFQQVAVVDANGVVRSSTLPGFVPVSVSDRGYFKAHANDNRSRMYIGKTVTGRLTGVPTIHLSRRINDASGKFLGVVVVSIAPSYLTELYDTLRIGRRAVITVIDTDDFSVLARRSGPSFSVNRQLPPGNSIRTALTGSPKGHFRYISVVDGIKRTVSYLKLPDYPLAVVVGYSASEYLHAFLNRAYALVAAGFLLTIVIVAAESCRTRLLRQMEESAIRERAADRIKILKAQRIESLFAAIPDAAIGLSAQGEIDGHNPHLLTLLGWTTQDLAHATPEQLAEAFFRLDRMQDRHEKARTFSAMLCDNSTGGAVSAVFRVETPEPVVYELRVERRYGPSTGTIALIRDITAQSRIKDSERDLDSTLQAIGDAVISVDADGCIKRMNTAAGRFSGWRHADAIGQPLSEVFPLTSLATGDLGAVPIAAVLSTGRLIRPAERYRLTSQNVRTRNVAISAAPVPGCGDRISGVVVVLRDVSREYASEQALIESEARYRQLIALSPYAVIVGQGGRIKFANPKAVEILGAQGAHELIGRRAHEFRPEDCASELDGNIATVETDRRAVPPMEEKWLRLDGSTFHAEVMAVPYEVDGAAGALVMLQDITQRKDAELERDRLFALSLDLTCVAQPGGYFKRVNPAFSRVLGWSSGELLSRPYIEFVHPDDRALTQYEVQLRSCGAPMGQFENRYRCKDGSYRWLAWKAIQLDGVTYATARDVTESRIETSQLEQARAEAEAASRAKSAFLATMSHEIRTPMNGVLGMTEVLARTALTRDQNDMVGTIRDSANSLLTIIDDILDFSKIEAERLQIECRPVAIVDLVDNVCASLTPLARRAGVALAAHTATDVPEVVLTDDTRLRQLLYNLLGNAIKFSGGRPGVTGSVSIRLGLSGTAPARISLEITDDGIGMSEQTLAGLFTPFSQAEVSTTRRFGGTGLGLAICRRLVDLMGGDLSVASALGKGSTFTLQLPLRLPDAQPVHELPDLDGITCIVQRSADFDSNRAYTWLTRARASVVLADDAVAIESAIQSADTEVLVVRAHDGHLPALPPLHSGDSAAAPVAELRIVPGIVGPMRVDRDNAVAIGSEGLRRQLLKDAALLAVGRLAPDAAPLPAQGQHATARDPSHLTVAQARADGQMILVAEDDEINQKVILRQLGLLGYVAEIAGDGSEALELWRSNYYALLLTDLHMPKMDGYELAATIRREETPGTRLPIVALTANAIQGEAARAAAAGMDDYLTKPLQLNRLQSILDRHFRVQSNRDEKKMLSSQAAARRSDCPVDIDVLKSIVGDDMEAVRELLGDYLASVRVLAPELRTYCVQGLGREAGAVAHKMKSSSRSVGAIELGNLCAELENAGKAGDLQSLASWVGKFDDALAAVELAIGRLLENNEIDGP